MEYDSTNESVELEEEEQNYSKWKVASIEKLKSKLQQNLLKRRDVLESCINSSARKIMEENTIQITPNPPKFRISATIINNALRKMNEIINDYEGVSILQCNEPKKQFSKYWRTADNWWNRQKSKWYGDLFFWCIFNDILPSFCQTLAKGQNAAYEAYHALYFIFLCDILYSQVSFKKSKANPLIFEASFKAPLLKNWFISSGEEHGHPWKLSTKQKEQSNTDYARLWGTTLRDDKYQKYKYCVLYRNDNIMFSQSPRPNINSQQQFVPTPINRFLPTPIRKKKFYYILEMENNRKLTQEQFDMLAQNTSIRAIYTSQNGSINPIYSQCHRTYQNPQSTYIEQQQYASGGLGMNDNNYLSAQCDVIGINDDPQRNYCTSWDCDMYLGCFFK